MCWSLCPIHHCVFFLFFALFLWFLLCPTKNLSTPFIRVVSDSGSRSYACMTTIIHSEKRKTKTLGIRENTLNFDLSSMLYKACREWGMRNSVSSFLLLSLSNRVPKPHTKPPNMGTKAGDGGGLWRMLRCRQIVPLASITTVERKALDSSRFLTRETTTNFGLEIQNKENQHCGELYYNIVQIKICSN